MSGFASVNFGQSESGLFTPEEIGRLMECEFQRSRRYDYPLAVLLTEIDRLESLHDLYGVDSRDRIVRSVVSLLGSSSRASDLLGSMHEGRLLTLLPHTSPPAAVTVARRLLSGCRELEFRGDGRVLRATLSIGIAQRAAGETLADMTQRAEQALLAALKEGGDRCLEAERLPRREPAPARPPAHVPAAIPGRARAAQAEHPAFPDLRAVTGDTLEEKVQSLFRLAGVTDVSGLEREVIETIQRTVSEARGRSPSSQEVHQEIRDLERRVARLKELLGASEEELNRMIQEKSADPGIASLYRTVQGLEPSARDYERKKALLAVIYQANVELLRQLREQAGGA